MRSQMHDIANNQHTALHLCFNVQVFQHVSLKRGQHLQKVFSYRLLRRHAPTILRRSLKDPIPSSRPCSLLHLLRQDPVAPVDIAIRPWCVACIRAIFTQFQDGGHIPTPIAIIRRTPHRNNSRIKLLLKPIQHKLMRSADKREIVLVIEALHDICTKQEPSAAGRETPAVDVIWIGP